jgi:hypothetical protein
MRLRPTLASLPPAPDVERGRNLGSMEWDLWVDYHRTDGDGLTHTNRRHLRPGVDLIVGSYLVVGDEDAEPAVAEVVSVDAKGIVLVRVLPGAAEEHLHLVRHRHPSAS